MPALGEYVNVYNSALKTLQGKGFQLWFDENADMFCAERDGWDFMADSPLSLLGLVAMYESRKPTVFTEYWWREDTEFDFLKLPKKPKPYESVVHGKPAE